MLYLSLVSFKSGHKFFLISEDQSNNSLTIIGIVNSPNYECSVSDHLDPKLKGHHPNFSGESEQGAKCYCDFNTTPAE